MTQIKGVLFDKDGTLFDFADTWEAWANAFLLRISDGDRTRAASLGRAIGFDLEANSFATDSIVIAGTPGEVASALLPHLTDMTFDRLIAVLNEEAANAPQSEVIPLGPFLQALRARGLRLGVATNDAEEPALAHLDSAGITHLFDFIAGFDSGYGGKPTPGQLNAFASRVGLPTHQIVMIGDSTHDLIAGKAAGMTCIAVLTGLASHDDLVLHADAVLPDISHLPNWLDQHRR